MSAGFHLSRCFLLSSENRVDQLGVPTPSHQSWLRVRPSRGKEEEEEEEEEEEVVLAVSLASCGNQSIPVCVQHKEHNRAYSVEKRDRSYQVGEKLYKPFVTKKREDRGEGRPRP